MPLFGETGRAKLHIPRSDGDEDAAGKAISAKFAAEVKIIGEIGRTLNGLILFLARDRRRDSLVALRLTRVPGQPDEFELNVARQLRDHTKTCPKCGSRIRSTGKFCAQCGADVSALQDPWTSEELRAAVQERAAERGFSIRDELRIPGGRVYFVTARDSRVLEALQVEETHNGDFALGASAMLRQLFAEVTAPGSS